MELSDIREKINAVDDQLLSLFMQRMDLAEEVAAYKNEHSLPILNKAREREILANVMEKDVTPCPPYFENIPTVIASLFLPFTNSIPHIDLKALLILSKVKSIG